MRPFRGHPPSSSNAGRLTKEGEDASSPGPRLAFRAIRRGPAHQSGARTVGCDSRQTAILTGPEQPRPKRTPASLTLRREQRSPCADCRVPRTVSQRVPRSGSLADCSEASAVRRLLRQTAESDPDCAVAQGTSGQPRPRSGRCPPDPFSSGRLKADRAGPSRPSLRWPTDPRPTAPRAAAHWLASRSPGRERATPLAQRKPRSFLAPSVKGLPWSSRRGVVVARSHDGRNAGGQLVVLGVAGGAVSCSRYTALLLPC